MRFKFFFLSLFALLAIPALADDTELGKLMDELNDHYKSIHSVLKIQIYPEG